MECPSCLTGHNLLDSLVGKKVRCKSCRQVFLVNGPAPEPPAQPEPRDEPKLPDSAELGPASLPSEIGRRRQLDDQFAKQRVRSGGPGARLSDAAPIQKAEEEPILREIPAPSGPEPILAEVPPPAQEEVVLEMVTSAPPPPRPAPPPRRPAEPDRFSPRRRRDDDRDYHEEPEPSGSGRTGLVIGLVAAGVLLLAGGGALAFFLFRGKDKSDNDQAAQQADAEGKNAANPVKEAAPNGNQPVPPNNQGNNQAGPVQPPNGNQAAEKRQPAVPVQPPPAEVAVWSVKADPAAEEVNIPPEKPISVAIPGNDHALFPSTPSRYVALGKNNAPTDMRIVWDLQENKQAAVLKGNIKLAEPFALSPDGRLLAGVVGAERGKVDVWSLETGQGIQRLLVNPNGWIDLVDFARPGQLVTIHGVGFTKMIQVWDVKTGQSLHEIKGPSGYDAKSEALSPGRKYLALVSNKKLLVYDLGAGKLAGEKAVPGGNDGFLSCQGMAFSPDGTQLAGLFGAFGKSRVITWDVNRGEVAADHAFARDLKAEAKHAFSYKGRPVEWQADGSGWLIFGQILVNRKSGNVTGKLPVDDNDFTPGPRKLIGKEHALVVASDAQRRRRLVNIRLSKDQLADGGEKKKAGNDGFKDLPLKEPDRANVRVVAAPAGPADWKAAPDPAAPARKALIASAIELPCKGMDVQRVLFASPETAQAAVLSSAAGNNAFAKKQLRLDVYDLTTGKSVGTVSSVGNQGLHTHTLSADLSPDGSVLAVRDTNDPNRLDVWSADGKHLAGWLPYGKGAFTTGASWVGFLDSQRLLTCSSTGQLTLWEVPACKAVYQLDQANPGAVLLSPGRKHLALFSESTFDLLDAAGGDRKGRASAPADLTFPVRATAAAFSPDGSQLAAVLSPTRNGQGYPLLVRWDLKTGKVLAQSRLSSAPGRLVCTRPGRTTGQWRRFGPPAITALSWWGMDHVLVNNEQLLDLNRKRVVWHFRLEGAGRFAEGSPDGRLWYASARDLINQAHLVGLPIPKKPIEDVVKTALGGKVPALIRPGMKVSLAFDCNVAGPPTNPEEFKTRLKEELTAWLQSNNITVADNQPVTLALRVAVLDSDKTFEVRDVFGPPGPLRPPPFGGLGPRGPRGPRMPRGPRPGPNAAPRQTFKAKKLMCQVLYADGKSQWQLIHTCEPRGGTSRKGDDPATYQLNNQWMDFSRWLSSAALPYYVARKPADLALPVRSLLTPDGIKAAPAQ
jgi:WD40 repeat protein